MKKLLLGAAVIGLVWLVVNLVGLVLAARAFGLVSQGNFQAARRPAQVARVFLMPLDLLGRVQPDTALIGPSLNQVVVLEQCAVAFSTYLETSLGEKSKKEEKEESDTNIDSSILTECILNSRTNLSLIHEKLEASWFARAWMSNHPKLNSVPEYLPQVVKVLELADEVSEGDKKIVMFLQNNHEIRSGGGFMGSFVELHFTDGVLNNWELVDVYEPDGQFDGFAEAPSGVAEYLSGGNGWRLPDTNWHADGPTAAQDVLRFMALGNRKDIDAALFINLSVAEEVLDVIGTIPLPDYSVYVTADNLAEVARADRSSFFEGSYQKTNFLEHLLRQLKLQVSSLENVTYERLFEILHHNLADGDIWAYSSTQTIQAHIEDLDWGLSLLPLPPETDTNHFWMYSLESNVGVNKANKHVDRSLQVDLSETNSITKITFTNTSPRSSASSAPSQTEEYINYYRLIFPEGTVVEQVVVENDVIESWDEEVITSSNDHSYLQVGFLVPVPPNSVVTAQVTAKHPVRFQEFDQSQNPLRVSIGRQPGIDPYPVTLSWEKKSARFLLAKPIRAGLLEAL